MLSEFMSLHTYWGKVRVYLWPWVGMSVFCNILFIYDLVRLYSAMG